MSFFGPPGTFVAAPDEKLNRRRKAPIYFIATRKEKKREKKRKKKESEEKETEKKEQKHRRKQATSPKIFRGLRPTTPLELDVTNMERQINVVKEWTRKKRGGVKTFYRVNYRIAL